MKNKKILALTTVIALSTTTLAFANEIKIVEKNGQDYVPFKKLVKKLGGEVEESKGELKANIDSTQIIIKNQSSFVKVDENYYPLEEKEINGYKVPINTKPTYEDKELCVSPEFLRSANLVNFDIEGGKLIIDNKVEKETTLKAKERPKKEEVQSSSETKKEEPKKEEVQEKPKDSVKPSKPNRPNNNNSNNTNNNQNNNNSNNNNSDNSNNNQNNGSNEGNSSENNSEEHENGGNTNEDNSQNNSSQNSISR
jgi:hypothetical protein